MRQGKGGKHPEQLRQGQCGFVLKGSVSLASRISRKCSSCLLQREKFGHFASTRSARLPSCTPKAIQILPPALHGSQHHNTTGFSPSQVYTFLPSHPFFHLPTPSSRLIPPLHSQGMSICNSLVQAEWARRRHFDLSSRLLPAPIVQLQCSCRQTLSGLWGGADEMGPSTLSRNGAGGEGASQRKRAGICKYTATCNASGGSTASFSTLVSSTEGRGGGSVEMQVLDRGTLQRDRFWQPLSPFPVSQVQVSFPSRPRSNAPKVSAVSCALTPEDARR